MRRRCILRSAVVVVLLVVAGVALYMHSTPVLVTARPRPDAGLLVADVRVIDVVTGRAHPHQDVVIEGEQIVAVLPHDPDRHAGERIDGAGATLVPGLVDAHCHVVSSPELPGDIALPEVELNLQRLLYAGVTTVFDPASDARIIFGTRAAVARETTLGPSIYAAGPVFTTPGGHPVAMVQALVPPLIRELATLQLAREVQTTDDVVEALEEVVAWKPDYIKMAVDALPHDVPVLEADLAATITREAAARGVATVAHIGTVEDARVAAQAGVSAWIHGVYKERIPDQALEELVSYHIPMVPTLTVFHELGGRAMEPWEPTALERDLASADVFERWHDPQRRASVPDAMRSFLDQIYTERETGPDNIKRLHDAGLTVLVGSDSQNGMLAGASTHIELSLLQRAGLTPLEVLQAATVAPARFFSGETDPPFGVVAAGKRADLLLVDGDPLADVSALSRIRTVVLRGRVLERTAWPGE